MPRDSGDFAYEEMARIDKKNLEEAREKAADRLEAAKQAADRLTPEDLRALEFLKLVTIPGLAVEGDDAWLNEKFNLLTQEIKLLGGPVCIDCQSNKARYTTDRCSLCDLKLPEDERGERL